MTGRNRTLERRPTAGGSCTRRSHSLYIALAMFWSGAVGADEPPYAAAEGAPRPAATAGADADAPRTDELPLAGEDELQIIDLESTWRLAGVQNPTIGAAAGAIREAEAMQRQAALKWIPDAIAGANYHKHVGVYQDETGQIRKVTVSSAYVGSGAFVVGTQTTTIPGVRLFTQVSDAIYEPLAARQRTAMRRFNGAATNNAVMLDVTLAYLGLLSAEARLEAWRASYKNIAEIVEITSAYAASGQGRQGDASRARAEGLLTVRELRAAEENVLVAAADLSRLLHLDPSVRLSTPGEPLRTYDLNDLQQPLFEFLRIAEQHRPEIRARAMDIAAGETRVRQEQTRPFLPTVMLGYSAGGLGGTGNFAPGIQPFSALDARSDFDAWLFWTLRNGGAGNIASANRRRGEVAEAAAQRLQTISQIRTEVTQAYADAKAARRRLRLAYFRFCESQAAFQADYARLRAAESLPLETLSSARLLAAARQDLVSVFIADNRSQFQLFVALGRPPSGAIGRYHQVERVPTPSAEADGSFGGREESAPIGG